MGRLLSFHPNISGWEEKTRDVCCTIRSIVFSEAGLYLTNIWNKELAHKYKIRGRVLDSTTLSHFSHGHKNLG